MSKSATIDAAAADVPASEAALLAKVGVVVIGRNEGARLPGCLASISPNVARVVYVDSGSKDDSVAIARRAGVSVIELDPARPFTAARARNEGFELLTREAPQVDKVQFVDGDCVFHPEWLCAAARVLNARKEVVAVAGRLRESYPDQSIYNQLCDLEWGSVPPGEARSFGGIVMMRCAALRKVGGWNAGVIAAEDDELSIRLRSSGDKVLRLADSMAFHDAAMTKFRQWWTRSTRAGHAFAQIADMHGKGKERYFVRECRRALIWGIALPATSVALAPVTLGASLMAFAAYPLQAARLAKRARGTGLSWKTSALWGGACVVARFAEGVGLVKYRSNRLRRRQTRIIEYRAIS